MFEDPSYNMNLAEIYLKARSNASEDSARKAQLAQYERQFAQEQQKLQQQQALMQLGSVAATTGDPEAIAKFSALNPEGAKGILEAYKYQTDQVAGRLQAYNEAKITDKPAQYELLHFVIKNTPGFDSSQYPSPESFDPKIVQDLVNSDLIATRDRSKGYQAQETADGLQAFDPFTGQLTPTGVGVYQKPPTSVVNVNNIAESEYSKATGKALGESDVKYYQDIVDKGDKARQQSSTLDAVENALDSIGTTGKFTGIGAVIGNVANQAGFEVVDKKKLANVELAKGELNKLVLPETKALGTGNGFTDKDREFLSQTFPQITDSYQGNKLKITLARKVNKRQIDVNEYADSLREQGASPFDIKKSIAKKYKDNPVFTKEDFELAKNPNQQTQIIRTQKPISEMSTEELMNLRGRK